MRLLVWLLVPVLSLLAAPPSAEARRRSVALRMPAFEVPARKNREVCVFVPVPAKHTMDVGEVVILNQGANRQFATHHMIVFEYRGDLDAVAALEGKPVDDPGCLDFGSGSPTALRIVATSQAIKSRQPMPRGTALQLEPHDMGGHPTIGLVLNSHWINGADRPQRARVKVKLVPARRVVKPLKPIFEAVANGLIKVPPGGTGEVGWQWGPGLLNFGSFLGGADNPTGPACVTMLIAHMHRRGTLFTAGFVDGANPEQEIYRTTQYADPPPLILREPLLVRPGQKITYRCRHDNALDPKLGCEEQAGVAPGRSVIEMLPDFDAGAAKACRTKGVAPEECPPTDPAYPDRTFTGQCVEANLVFGFTSEDEMCILPGYYYDGDPDAAPGAECDL
jgi:hypothetical protein